MWYLFCRKLSEVGWNYQKPILLGPEIYQPPLLQKQVIEIRSGIYIQNHPSVLI